MLDRFELRSTLAGDAETVRRLPEIMRECGVEIDLNHGVANRCGEIADDLQKAARR